MTYAIQKLEFDKIQARLGRPIDIDGDRLSGYHDIGDSELQDLRLLAQGSTIDATSYLLFLLGGKGGLANAASYISYVIRAGMSHAEWLQRLHKAS